VAFKAVVTGDVTDASVKNKAKGLASGSYTFWAEDPIEAAAIGASRSAGSTVSVQACLNACDTDGSCAAVVMTGLVTGATTANKPTACSLVKGDATVATFKRSVTKAVVTKLLMPVL
jgi:hypothetical protein